MTGTAWIDAGLGFGDEGKGSTTDYLVRSKKARAVIRYNGGAQAGHRVVLPDGREHSFSQFGSGTFVPGCLTHLSRFMLVEPFGLMSEYEHLRELGFEDALQRLSIDEEAPIITPFHIATNRLIELGRSRGRHGSCGLGIWETTLDVKELGREALLARDLLSAPMLRKKLLLIRARKLAKAQDILGRVSVNEAVLQNRKVLEEGEAIIDRLVERFRQFASLVKIVDANYLRLILDQEEVVFEGAQGMLLDPHYGFHPHTTGTDITYNNALTLLEEAGFQGTITKIGIFRGYFTRHGAGPFVSEDENLSKLLPDANNKDDGWQGNFRVGHFDALAARYAMESIGVVDFLALTNLDRLIGLREVRICTGYDLVRSEVDPEEDLFEWNGNTATGIRVSRLLSNSRQTRLTQALCGARPIYEDFGAIKNRADAQAYVRRLSELLGCPVNILSFGPIFKDKIDTL